MIGIRTWFHGFRLKMLLLVLVPCIFISALVSVIFLITREVSTNAAQITDVRVPSIRGLQMMEAARYGLRMTFSELFSNKDHFDFNDLKTKFDVYMNDYHQGWDIYAPLEQTTVEETEWNAFVPIAKNWEDTANNVKNLILENKIEEANQLFSGPLRELFLATKLRLDQIAKINYEVIEREKKLFHHANKRAQWMSIFFAIIGTLVTAIFGFYIANSLTHNLSLVAEHIATSSSHVHQASGSLLRSAESLSTSARQQASSIEETSNSISVITRVIESNVALADESNQKATTVQKISEEATSFMENLTQAMNDILESNSRIEMLVKIIEEIGDKTEIIDDIVFKTQLLSFNASVEAERAGEQGRGFAVVAQEVGNLAQLSGRSASEISSIVKNSIKEAESVARGNKERVERGSELAIQTKEKILQVSKMISEIQEGTDRIAMASKEQSQSLVEINVAVEHLNRATHTTAKNAEDSSGASNEMSTQSTVLKNLVSKLRYLITGKKEIVSDFTETAKQDNSNWNSEGWNSKKEKNKFRSVG